MTLTPLINTDPVIQLHIASALLALLLGPIALYRTRRDSLHRWTGYLWVGAMFTVALSSFWIHHFGVIGPFSPIHVCGAYALVSGGWDAPCVRAPLGSPWPGHAGTLLAWARRCGAVTLLPGRVFNRMFFPEMPELGYGVIALCGGAVFAVVSHRAPTIFEAWPSRVMMRKGNRNPGHGPGVAPGRCRQAADQLLYWSI